MTGDTGAETHNSTLKGWHPIRTRVVPYFCPMTCCKLLPSLTFQTSLTFPDPYSEKPGMLLSSRCPSMLNWRGKARAPEHDEFPQIKVNFPWTLADRSTVPNWTLFSSRAANADPVKWRFFASTSSP